MALDLGSEVEALFRAKIQEFLDWTEETWVITEKEKKEEWVKDKSEDYCQGYNSGIEALKTAFSVWADEMY